MRNYYQGEMECAKPGAMRALQDERLAGTVRHVYKNVAHYRNLMDAKGVSPDDVKSVDDLPKLPFITKDALRDE